MESKVYNQVGKEVGKVSLSPSIFGLPWNADLVHQVVTSMKSSARTPVAHTKNRGDVRGGGKKPWQQKGTGQARHGSSRSPLWVGGGVTHGPRNDKNFQRKVNKKMKAKALNTILSKKYKEGEIMFLDGLKFENPKAKIGREVLSTLSKISGFEKILSKRKNSAYIALHKKDLNTEKSLRNFSNIEVNELRNANPVSLLQYKYIVITNPSESLKFFDNKVTGIK